ncbi:hypothetical protein [Gryllotalpicola koreensis]|uniref:Integral membrane protein n=1 Tax=Gryllotalpicola koreensis TaxID=993086 RepID=A0ABP7ZWS0_9MICO
MGDAAVDRTGTDEARKARKRASAKRRRRRAAWRDALDWRGAAVPALGWYIAALAVAYGIVYGLHAGLVRPGQGGGIGVVLTGCAVAVAWGAAVWAAAPPVIGVVLTVAGLFAGMLAFGPSWPAAMSAGVVAQVGGFMLGVQLRYLIVGRRRAADPAADTAVQKRRPRSLKFTKSQRTDLIISAIMSVAMLVIAALYYLVPTPNLLGTWLLLVVMALAWSAPLVWWPGPSATQRAASRAPFNVALWGVLFNVFAAAAFGGGLLVLLASLAGIGLGSVTRGLYTVTRHARSGG